MCKYSSPTHHPNQTGECTEKVKESGGLRSDLYVSVPNLVQLQERSVGAVPSSKVQQCQYLLKGHDEYPFVASSKDQIRRCLQPRLT